MKNLMLSDAVLGKLNVIAHQRNCSVESLLESCLAYLETEAIAATPSVPPMLTSDVLELASDAVVIIDNQQKIAVFSQGAKRIFGYAAEEIIGQPLDILLPEGLRQGHREHVHHFENRPESNIHMNLREKVYGKRKNGTVFPAEISLLKYVENDTLYYAALMRDVSFREEIIARLRERESTLSLITDNATDLICLHEPDGTYTYVSPSIQFLTGFTPEELVSTNPYSYFHPDDLAQIQASHNASLSGDQVRGVTYRFRKKDGEYTWLETITNPIKNAAGEIVNLVTVTRDVSERLHIQQELKQERDLLALLMDTSPSAVTVVDYDGRITFANRRAAELYRMDKDSLMERTYNAPTWKHTDYEGNFWPDENQPFVRVMETKAPVWDVRHAIESDDGERIYLSINGAPILDEQGEVSKVMFTTEDYTHRKLQQDKLEAALKREKRLNELKSDFITLVSHEFRTPMAIIMTSTGILRKKLGNLSPEELLARLEKIETQIRRLDTLISDITFINKDELVGHKVHPDMVNLQQFFEQLVEEVNTVYPAHRPVQTHAESVVDSVYLDPALMQQIFVNLLSNAMKYSPDDSTVVCSYTCTSKTLEVVIIDEGIGIPPEDRQNLFKEFHRAANTGFVPGTGLGLAIVKRALKALNGTIEFDSQLNSGTQFRISLPIISQ